MIIGHLPAGYLSAHLLRWGSAAVRAIDRKWIVWAALAGSVFPDLDMLYFYLLDHRQHHHHRYWTHLPIFWLIVLPAVLLVLRSARREVAFILSAVFGANVALHLLLDSIVGHIWWLYPFVDTPFSLATVPAAYKPWWLSFVLHWSFLLEVALLAAATYVYVGEANRATPVRRTK